MRARYLVFVLALLGADVAPSGGTITGTVAAAKDGKKFARDDIYVYLESVPGQTGTNPGAGSTYKIAQKVVGKEPAFDPKILVVPVGATVFFPNLQPRESHNVFSPTEPIFDLGKYAYDKTGKSRKFELAEEFDIFCDVHPFMWAKIKVVNSAYIEKVVNGSFTFKNIPPGKYKVVAWVRNSPEVKSSVVTVTAGGTFAIDRELHVQLKSRSGCHVRIDKTPYDAKYGKPCPVDY